MPALAVTLLSVLGPAVLGLVGWGLTALTNLIKTKTNNAVLTQLAGQVSSAVTTALQAAYQGLVTQGQATTGTPLSPAASAAATTAALATVKLHLGPAVLTQLQLANGLTTTDALDAFLTSHIQAAEHTNNLAMASAVAPATSATTSVASSS